MGCGCNKGGVGRGGQSDTLGFYVVKPDGQVLPAGVNPDEPTAGTPPFMLYAEAHAEVIGVGGTIHRLRRKP
jgi:hypothetical protein